MGLYNYSLYRQFSHMYTIVVCLLIIWAQKHTDTLNRSWHGRAKRLRWHDMNDYSIPQLVVEIISPLFTPGLQPLANLATRQLRAAVTSGLTFLGQSQFSFPPISFHTVSLWSQHFGIIRGSPSIWTIHAFVCYQVCLGNSWTRRWVHSTFNRRDGLRASPGYSALFCGSRFQRSRVRFLERSQNERFLIKHWGGKNIPSLIHT